MRRLAVVVLDPVAELSQHGLGIPQRGAEDVVALEGVDEGLGEPVALWRIRWGRDRDEQGHARRGRTPSRCIAGHCRTATAPRAAPWRSPRRIAPRACGP